MRKLSVKKITANVLSIIISLGVSISVEALSCGWENKQFVIYQSGSSVEMVVLGKALSYQVSPDDKTICLQTDKSELSFWKTSHGGWINTQSISVKSIIASYQFSGKALYVTTSNNALLVYEKDVCGYYNSVPSIAITNVLTYSLDDNEKTISISHVTNPNVTYRYKNMGTHWESIS